MEKFKRTKKAGGETLTDVRLKLIFYLEERKLQLQYLPLHELFWEKPTHSSHGAPNISRLGAPNGKAGMSHEIENMGCSLKALKING